MLILSFEDGEVVEIGEFGSYGTVFYLERESVIVNMFENQGRYSGQLIKINDDFSTDTLFSYFNNADMAGVTVVYKINDEEVSIEKYNAEMEENWPDNSEIEESGKYSGQYDLTPENIDTYC